MSASAASSNTPTAQKLLLDCDTGIDDTLALLYLLAHPSVELAAVLSTAGNVPVAEVDANNRALLELCGRDDIEVCRGADGPLAIELRTCEDTHGPYGLGYADRPASTAPSAGRPDRDAADAWIEITRDRPGELVGLVVGPCTNLALAIRRDPDLPTRLKRLVIMGGSFVHPGNTTPVAEWNVLVDPEAAHEVFTAFGTDGAPQPIVCGLQLTEQIAFTPEHLTRLAELAGSTPIELATAEDDHGRRSVSDNRVIALLTDALRFYFEFHHSVGEGYRAHVHDPFAAAVAIDPGIVQTRPAVVDVELDGSLTRGMTVADEGGFWGRPANAQIADRTDVDAFFDDLLSRLATLARRIG
ncbi:nucleoside hydrolase [Microlunatus soli]|uniref:Inosine-uridine nucleoside N-ribohydrolase n=1 Tax=Microlunatus soli TaxID=630515 RepID=A0A1H1UD33_9ACTN|nr:nucleoside hydrolase [Microlunatus soli]SDS70404.1 Inosine-uridine nucleoside N-ribohydrolase [Microlunatus soli]